MDTTDTHDLKLKDSILHLRNIFCSKRSILLPMKKDGEPAPP